MSVHISTILESYPGATRLLRAGQTIFRQGDLAAQMYRIESGHVRLRAEGIGQRETCAFLFAGDLFGQFAGERSCSAEAASDIVLKEWPIRTILDLCGRSPEIMMALATRADVAFADLVHAVPRLNHLPPIERVIWFLNWLVRRGKGAGEVEARSLPTSRRDMAEFLSLSPEALGEAISCLEAMGYLHAASGRGFTPRPGVFNGGRLEAGPARPPLREANVSGIAASQQRD